MTPSGLWDLHVHSDRSWDAPAESTIVAMAAAAAAAGLTGIAITDHFDSVPGRGITIRRRGEQFDVDAHVARVAAARGEVEGVRLLAGLEYGEPQLNPRELERVRADSGLDIVLGSVHAIVDRGELIEVEDLTGRLPQAQLVRRYLEDVLSLVEDTAVDVLTHLELPYRYAPIAEHDVRRDDSLYAQIFEAAADREIAIEYNTKSVRTVLPALLDLILDQPDLQFTIGGDAHDTTLVGHGFDRARTFLESTGRQANPESGRWTSNRHAAAAEAGVPSAERA